MDNAGRLGVRKNLGPGVTTATVHSPATLNSTLATLQSDGIIAVFLAAIGAGP